MHLCANADLVLAAGREVIKALPGGATAQGHFLLLTIWKGKENDRLQEQLIEAKDLNLTLKDKLKEKKIHNNRRRSKEVKRFQERYLSNNTTAVWQHMIYDLISC